MSGRRGGGPKKPRPDKRKAQDRPHQGRHERGRGPGHGDRIDPERCVVGRHAVEAVLMFQSDRAETLFVDDKEAQDSATLKAAEAAGVRIDKRDRAGLDRLAGPGLVHQGVVLKCRPFPYADLDDVLAERPSLLMLLDGVEDPRNLGATVRAAFGLGADGVIIPRRRAAQATASAHKTAAGALSRLPLIQVENVARALEKAKEAGMWIVGAEGDAPAAPWDVDLKTPTVLVIGGEDRGLRRLTRAACDHVVAIPMVDARFSLNAADAATVLLYEVRRQRA